MKLSERFYEIWGLTHEGGEERTYALRYEVKQLEAENEAFKNRIRNSLFGMTTEQENEWLAEVVKEHTDALKESKMTNKEKTTVGSMCPGSTIPINFFKEKDND